MLFVLESVELLELVAWTGVGRAWTEARWRMIGVRSVSCISMVILGDD